jgi:RNA-binding protein YhbY
MSEQKAIRRANGQFKPGYKPPTAWEKGESGNLNGRRGSLKDILDTIGDEVDDKGISTREQIMRKVTTMAKRGDMKAIADELARRLGAKVLDIRGFTVTLGK